MTAGADKWSAAAASSGLVLSARFPPAKAHRRAPEIPPIEFSAGKPPPVASALCIPPSLGLADLGRGLFSVLWWTCQQLRMGNAKSRLTVVEKLVASGDKEAVGPLIFALQDKDATVRCAAAKALMRFHD